jgi:hypothetical protein
MGRGAFSSSIVHCVLEMPNESVVESMGKAQGSRSLAMGDVKHKCIYYTMAM